MNPNALNLLKRMLKKSPLERISPGEAIAHSYFSETMEEEEEVDIVPELMKPKSKENQNCESPLLTTSNQERLLKKRSSLVHSIGWQPDPPELR